MNCELKQYKDYIVQLACLLSQHSLNNTDSHSLRDARLDYAYELLDFLLGNIKQDTFESIVFTDNTIDLYCYSELSYNQLKMVNAKYLCTSKLSPIPIGQNSVIHSYKHYYKLRLLNNSFAIDINQILQLLSKKDLRLIEQCLYGNIGADVATQLVHYNEQEVIVKINDIILIEDLWKKKN